MLISPAYAQAGGGGAFGGDLISFLPLILIFVVFWFFLIRPQQKKMKEHREMVGNLKRGDEVVTGGGIIGKVTKVIDENRVEVELADDVRVKVIKATVTDVLSKTEPAANKPKGANDDGAGAGGEKKSLFSFGSKK